MARPAETVNPSQNKQLYNEGGILSDRRRIAGENRLPSRCHGRVRPGIAKGDASPAAHIEDRRSHRCRVRTKPSVTFPAKAGEEQQLRIQIMPVRSGLKTAPNGLLSRSPPDQIELSHSPYRHTSLQLPAPKLPIALYLQRAPRQPNPYRHNQAHPGARLQRRKTKSTVLSILPVHSHK